MKKCCLFAILVPIFVCVGGVCYAGCQVTDWAKVAAGGEHTVALNPSSTPRL